MPANVVNDASAKRARPSKSGFVYRSSHACRAGDRNKLELNVFASRTAHRYSKFSSLPNSLRKRQTRSPLATPLKRVGRSDPGSDLHLDSALLIQMIRRTICSVRLFT
ncbi:hypothetical protein EVAR_47268_1 [Eumeta japonica]|uniref:Uncharacterized protein n=1 Tax=Eumeta variegata TaxID=151549 RepID=A0A4C1XGS4_EUMVA|nr:hypothetical protein EVAR_47268_1 [Eumeta japonica]